MSDAAMSRRKHADASNVCLLAGTTREPWQQRRNRWRHSGRSGRIGESDGTKRSASISASTIIAGVQGFPGKVPPAEARSIVFTLTLSCTNDTADCAWGGEKKNVCVWEED